MNQDGFQAKTLTQDELAALNERARQARGDILTMTTLAGCGHPGGSMSSIEMYITLFSCAKLFPDRPRDPGRDRIVISHGHTSPGAYAALAQTGFIDRDAAIIQFRYPGSPFEGHVERCVPGIEWGTGNLGQGLSAGCGFALAARLTGTPYHTYVVMGDGEQQKGQISEARRFAAKYALSKLTVLIDLNHLQISGSTGDVMPQNIVGNFRSDGWNVIECDGHDIVQLYAALKSAATDSVRPTAIIASTVMGRGVSFMENREKYHGVALTEDQLTSAFAELDLPDSYARYREERSKLPPIIESIAECGHQDSPAAIIETGTPLLYTPDKKTDNRSAFGAALKDLAECNRSSGNPPLAVLDCDLASSVKTNAFQSVLPEHFFETGIQEHHAATMAGALSVSGVTTFFADFGVFGVCETYNQHRLNDINGTNLKLVCTHIGWDVGEDGKTHQCIDYIGLLQNLFGFKIVVPADPNQTDHATRYIAATQGNFFLGMGRSKLPVICREDGTPFFDQQYRFTYGSIDVIRQGSDAAILSYGGLLHSAVTAARLLGDSGISVQVLNVSCPKHIDIDTLRQAAGTGLLITLEDHNVHTGLGTIIADTLIAHNLHPRLIKRGVTAYGFSGTPEALYRSAGLDAESLAAVIKKAIGK